MAYGLHLMWEGEWGRGRKKLYNFTDCFMFYNDWVFFSFTWFGKYHQQKPEKKNLNIVTDKGIQRTYLAAIKINHKTIRIYKTNNYSLPQHLLFCVLGFVFNFVHSMITLCGSLAIHWLHKTIAFILKDESLTSVANLQTSLIFHSWKILEQNILFDLHIFYKILYIQYLM